MKNILKRITDQKNNIQLFLGVFIASLFWLLIFTPTDGLWYDECFTLFHSQGSHEAILKVATWDSNPPLYLMIIKKWIQLIGFSELKLRLFSLISTSLFISTTVVWIKTIYGKTTSIFAWLLLFFSEVFIEYAHEARVYSLLFFLIILNSILIFRLIQKPNILIGIIIGCINSIIFFSHYIEGITVLVQLFFIGIVFISKDFRIKDKIKILAYYIFGFCIFIYYVDKWKHLFLELLFNGGNKVVLPPMTSDIPRVLYELMNHSFLFVIALLCSFVIGLFIFVRRFKSLEHTKKWASVYLIVFLLISFLGIYFASYKAPMFCRRYLMFTTFALILLLSITLSSLKSTVYKYGLFVLMFILFNLNNSFKTEKEMNVKAAVKFIKNKHTSKSLIIVQSKDIVPNFTLYFNFSIFKKYWLIEEQLTEKNVIAINELSPLLTETNLNSFDKIFFFQVFDNFVDPQKTVFKFLNSKLKMTKEEKSFRGIKLHIFEPNKLNTNYSKDNCNIQQRYYMLKIISDSAWLSDVVSKARNQNITLDSALLVESNWLISEDKRKLDLIK
jgi:hypothetical protein